MQKPLIPSLITGRLAQSDYNRALAPTRSVYQAIDKQLKADFDGQIGKLEDLRSLAEAHIWKDLHGDWLPRLEKRRDFLPKFKYLLRDALAQARWDPYLEYLTNTVIAVVAIPVALDFVHIAGPIAGSIAGIAASKALDLMHKRVRETTKPYTLFFQGIRQTR